MLKLRKFLENCLNIPCLKKRVRKIPLIGGVIAWFYNFLRLNTIKRNLSIQIQELDMKLHNQERRVQEHEEKLHNQERRVQEHEEKLYNQERRVQEQKQELDNYLKQLSFDLQDTLDILEQKLDEKASIEDTTELYNQLLNQKERFLEDSNKLDKIITKASQLLPKRFTHEDLKDISHMQRDKFAPLYKDFEDKFRGKREKIKLSLEIYLPLIKNLTMDTTALEILDIGCGRGEWLELLRENGFHAKGIDVNEEMIQVCQKRGLDVFKSDAIEYLKNLPNNSLAAITGFHIIEHFDNFNLVLELLYDSYRVLKKGGIVLFETPNTRNILVGANDFYLDPTHNRPLHPFTMEFFLSKIGFKETKILAVKDKSFTNIKEIEFATLEDYVTIGRDYALIGYKP